MKELVKEYLNKKYNNKKIFFCNYPIIHMGIINYEINVYDEYINVYYVKKGLRDKDLKRYLAIHEIIN